MYINSKLSWIYIKKKVIKDITQEDYRLASGVPYWKLIQIQERKKVTGHLVDCVSYRICILYSVADYLNVSGSGSNTSVGGERANFSAIVYLLLCSFC